MPTRAPRAIPQGGPRHSDRDRLRQRRAEGLGRLYDSAQWRRRTVPHVLARDPLCKIAHLCQGCDPSTDVDHIIAAEVYVEQHGGDERFFFDETNLQGCCHADHTAKTSRERDARKG
jgi:5-methylcytosine-specific restriction endonuclease McrA